MSGFAEVPKLLRLRDMAAREGISYDTARTYHTQATARRRAGTQRRGDWPKPDGRIGRTPVWLPSTYEAWSRSRPGQGAGGGRRRSS